MELVIALGIIFSVMALYTAIYTCKELMKLRDMMKGILDLNQYVLKCLITKLDILRPTQRKG